MVFHRRLQHKMSSNDLLAKFDELVKLVESEKAKMKAEIETYEAEKLRMKGVEVSGDDIINLNVGGVNITTTRSTLCQVEGSFLASMFSGRWEKSLARDENGRVFFDFNPQYFAFILDYLRAKKISTPENPAPLPKVPEDQVKHFNNLVEYLGLSNEIMPAEIVPNEKFNLHSTGVTLAEGGIVAVHDSTQGHKYVLGENIYREGVVKLKLKIESFQNNNWMFVGMVKGDFAPQNDISCNWPVAYGWTLGSSGQVWKEGSHSIDNTLKNLTKPGDMVELVLDCDAGKLSLHLPPGQQFHIDLPKSQTWRLNVGLYGANDKIRIVNA